MTPEQHERELRRFTKHVPFAPKCGVVRQAPCRHAAEPVHIGESVADGVHQPLYQCPVCHSLLTETEAFR